METHDKIYKKAIPEAIASMNSRNQLLEQYIVKVEKDFLSMGGSGGGANGDGKAAANERVKKQLLSTLAATADDIDNIASSLETLVAGQTRQVETLIVDIDLVNQKIRLNKEIETTESLNRLLADTSK